MEALCRWEKARTGLLFVVVPARPKLLRWARPRDACRAFWTGRTARLTNAGRKAAANCGQLIGSGGGAGGRAPPTSDHPQHGISPLVLENRGIMDHRRISPCLVSVRCAGAGRHLRSSIEHRPSLDSQRDTTLPCAGPSLTASPSPELAFWSVWLLYTVDAMHPLRIFNPHLFHTHSQWPP